MERARLDGVELEYERIGSGEPAVFIHGAFIADAFRPLALEPSLAERHQLILYRRRGYGGSEGEGDPTVEQQAADCLALLAHLGISRAHVVGHSYGGCVALQLSLAYPDAVHSLALLEPALAVGASGEAYRQSLADAARLYREEGGAALVERAFEARWPGYRADLEQSLPGSLAQAVRDAGASVREVGWLLDWEFSDAQARQIRHPVLRVLGGASGSLSPRFGETHEQLATWWPSAEEYVLADATHFLHLEGPAQGKAMAEALANFFARHPIAAAVD